MATLNDLVASRMTPEVMQKLAGLAGLNATNAKRAIDALIPTQLYDLVSMGATEAGANRLLSLLKEHKGTESFGHVLLAGEAVQSQANAPVAETLGLHFVRVLGFEEKDGDTDPVHNAWARVATPSGKAGFTAPNSLLSPYADRLCYGKEGTGWRIVGYVGGGD